MRVQEGLLLATMVAGVSGCPESLDGHDHEKDGLANHSADEELILHARTEEASSIDEILEPEFCIHEQASVQDSSVDLTSVHLEPEVHLGDEFIVDFLFQNTGDTRLLLNEGSCPEGTFFNIDFELEPNTQWTMERQPNGREDFADPGDLFQISYVGEALEEDDVLRQFFQPSIDGIGTIGEEAFVDINMGEPSELMQEHVTFIDDRTILASTLDEMGRNLDINLTDQEVTARFGNSLVIWTMPISSGKESTPTVTGRYRIIHKQEDRVQYKEPHYRMPYWQGFYEGFGMHAVPYLKGEYRGEDWQIAYDQIGEPVSSGCIRLYPRDAERLFDFTEVGDPVWIHE